MTPDNEQYNGDDDTYYMNGPDEFVKGEPENFYDSAVKGFAKLEEENTRLRKLIEKAFDAGRKSDYEPYDESWEQFKKDNGL